MPRYYFDYHDGGSVIDETGTEFPDTASARDAAVKALLNLVPEIAPTTDDRVFEISVRDGKGRRVFRATVTVQDQLMGGAAEPVS